MNNEIVRPLAHNLGFDSYGQLWVWWDEDGSKRGTIVSDMREKTCAICGNGWDVTAESFRTQHYDHNTEEWYHRRCYVGYLSLHEYRFWFETVCAIRNNQSAITAFNVEKLPNGYGGGWDTPWYRFRFKGFLPWIKVGTRRHVYHMSLHDLRKEQLEAFTKLVEPEPVTKGTEYRGEAYIHAHGSADAVRYMEIFFRIINLDKVIADSGGAQIFDISLNKQEEPKQLTESKAADASPG